MEEHTTIYAVIVQVTANNQGIKMAVPRFPISKQARDHLLKKLDRMKGREKKKTVDRLNAYDRGFKKKEDTTYTRGDQ